MNRYEEIANTANIIVNGYAFIKEGNFVRVLNLNRTCKAAFITYSGEVLETSMDDIELDIMLDYYIRNRKYLEV